MDFIHPLTIRRVTPWSQFNEYEGEVEGTIDELEVCCYVMLPSGDWNRFRPGDTVPALLRVERSGEVQVGEGGSGSMTRIDGVYYRVSGRVERVEGDRLGLASLVTVEVDLDRGQHVKQEIPDVASGDWISVVGRLQAELEPDSD